MVDGINLSLLYFYSQLYLKKYTYPVLVDKIKNPPPLILDNENRFADVDDSKPTNWLNSISTNDYSSNSSVQ